MFCCAVLFCVVLCCVVCCVLGVVCVCVCVCVCVLVSSYSQPSILIIISNGFRVLLIELAKWSKWKVSIKYFKAHNFARCHTVLPPPQGIGGGRGFSKNGRLAGQSVFPKARGGIFQWRGKGGEGIFLYNRQIFSEGIL